MVRIFDEEYYLQNNEVHFKEHDDEIINNYYKALCSEHHDKLQLDLQGPHLFIANDYGEKIARLSLYSDNPEQDNLLRKVFRILAPHLSASFSPFGAHDHFNELINTMEKSIITIGEILDISTQENKDLESKVDDLEEDNKTLENDRDEWMVEAQKWESHFDDAYGKMDRAMYELSHVREEVKGIIKLIEGESQNLEPVTDALETVRSDLTNIIEVLEM